MADNTVIETVESVPAGQKSGWRKCHATQLRFSVHSVQLRAFEPFSDRTGFGGMPGSYAEESASSKPMSLSASELVETGFGECEFHGEGVPFLYLSHSKIKNFDVRLNRLQRRRSDEIV